MPEKSQNFSPTHVFHHLERAGDRGRPRLVPVSLDSPENARIWAVFAVPQGKRPGSKSDFSDSFRIGGLFVPRETPPLAGVVKYVAAPDIDMPVLRDRYADWAHWKAADIHQALFTNGRLWFALVRDTAGYLRVREAFATPGVDLKHPFVDRFGNYENADDPVPFQERIFRALIPWARLDAPEYLGAFLASHVRSFARALETDPARAPLWNRYAEVLERDLGLTFTGATHDAAITRHLVAQMFLRCAGEVVAKAEGIELEAAPPPGWSRDFDKLPVRDGFLDGSGRYEMDPFVIVADRLRKYADPGAVAAFGRAFWRAASEDAYACKSWNDLPEPVVAAHMNSLERRLSEQVPLLENLGNPKLHVLDLHAGVGLTLAPLLTGGSARAALTGTVFAFEADPVKYRLLRLQVLLALARRKRARHALPAVHLSLACPLYTPGVLARLPDDARVWLIAGDLRFADSAGMTTVCPAEDRVARYRTRLRDQWRIHTFDAADPFVHSTALLEGFANGRKSTIASLLFTPGRWLEADGFASVREAVVQNADRVWISRLPATLATHTQARKDGLASLLTLRLLPGRRSNRLAEVSVQTIAYVEDIPVALADSTAYRPLAATADNRFTLAATRTSHGYESWPSLRDIGRIAPICGPAERRNFATIRDNRAELAAAMQAYFDRDLSDDDLARMYPKFMEDAPRFNARETRDRLLRKFAFDDNRIVPFPFKPFDIRWSYQENLRRLIKEPSPDLQRLARIPGNRFLLVAEPNDRAPEGLSAWFSEYAADYDFFSPGAARHFPLYVEKEKGSSRAATSRKSRAAKAPAAIPNLSDRTLAYLDGIRPQIADHDDKLGSILAQQVEEGSDPSHRRENVEELIWYFILGVLFTPAYQQENGEALQRDWPRIPIPHRNDPQRLSWQTSSLKTFATHGRRIAELLSMKPLDPDEWSRLDTIAVLSTADGHTPTPDELRLSNTWSQKSKGNAIRPGKGLTTTRTYTQKEQDELAAALHNFCLQDIDSETVFGAKTVDVHLSEGVCWRNIPQAAWNYEVGGHLALRKWLSYRGVDYLQRPLTLEECRNFTQAARRIVLLILIGQRLNVLWPKLRQEASV